VVRLPLPDGTEYEYVLGPFWGKVLTSECTYQFRPSKIEMKLPKQESRKWHALEAAKADVGADVTPTAAPKTAPSAPTYPTSSRNGPKDWDKVASSLSGNSAKKSEGGKQKDDDSDDELGGDSVDGFFKQLYAGADPETRRAMIKSYTESQGTSLSTNWSEVGKGTVKPVESDKN
jgi:suppressor of G2 allele of SKP1